MAKKETPKSPQKTSSDNARRIKSPTYKSFKLSKKLKHPAPKLAPARVLMRGALKRIWQNKKLFGGVLAIYAVAQILLVQGLFANDFVSLAQTFDDAIEGGWNTLFSSVALFTVLFGTSGQGVSAEGGVYQTILFIILSLALIWALRHSAADVSVRIRDAYYKGMYPLIPFILVILVIMLQLFPLLIGVWLYQTLIAVGIAVTAAEQIFWLIVTGLFALLTLYMLCSSVIAAYIVTLPDMTPMQALRSARKLVIHRRLGVFWRLLVLGFWSIAILAAVVIPIIMVIPVIAPWVFYLMSILVIAMIHSYMYGFYRELLIDA